MRLHDDILLDILCHLGRFNLDAVSISSRKLCQAVIHRMSKMCLRHLQSAVLAGGIRMRPEGGDEVKHPKASDIGRRLRSSYVEYLTLTPECIKGRPTHIEGVVHEMLKHANTIAVDRMELSSVLFSPPELTLATRLVEALLAVNDVTFNGNFPERRFDPSKFELYTSPHRIMDEEILQYCKKKTANDSRRSVSFNKASVTENFVHKVAEARKCGDLPDTLILWISSRSRNPEQDLSEVEHAEAEHHVNIMGAPRQLIVSPDLVVGFGYDAARDHRGIAIWDNRSFAAKYENTK